jgi:diguanylate cyclase (GGDEF)-like protein/PAS domain S-box-containing protein
MLLGFYDYRLVAFSISLATMHDRWLIHSIFFGTALVLSFGVLYFLTVGRRKNAVAKAGDGEERFRLLAEAIPQIVWTAIPGGGIDYCNQRFYELTGLSKEHALGLAWQKALHPDDRPLALQNWENSRRTGTSYDVEYRLRTAAGEYRWHLVRATPMLDSAGAVVKWYGACTDIDDQMRHQELLESQLKEHTDALMDANIRLQTEIRERALAQQELNLQSERMVQDLTVRSNRATNLAKMAELLQSCATVRDACSVVAGMAPKVFLELRGALLLLDSSRNVLEAAANWSECVLAGNEFKPEDCWALRTGRPHLVAAGDHTVECGHAANGQHSSVCLPLLAHGEAIGVVHFQMKAPGELSQPVLLIANMFAEQISLSIANIRLRDALRTQSIHDPLTGLYNRRYLEEMMERETRRAVRAEHGLGVLMLDLDHFKKFNDTYGHDAGDLVLREAAAFLLKSVRAEDIVCRFGGEEFVVILPLADLKVTEARAERIRSRLRELSVAHQGQSLGMITVSVGVAELPEHGTTAKELLESADAALYRAKREGRDRVAVAKTSQAAEVEL